MGRRNVEDVIQIEYVKWLSVNHPEIEVYYNKNEGKKHIITAMQDKRKGLKKARPDLDLIMKVRSIYHFLHQELKTKTGKLSPDQKAWHANFIPTKNRQACVSYGLHQAQEHVLKWLEDIQKK